MLSILANSSTTVNPDWHVNCFYQDAYGARIVIHRFGGGEALDLSPQTAVRLQAEIGGFVDSQEGFDDDPTATIYFLSSNQLGQLLNEAEQQLLSAAIVRMWQAANPSVPVPPGRNRGTMNVMNRIEQKRRRNGRRLH